MAVRHCHHSLPHCLPPPADLRLLSFDGAPKCAPVCRERQVVRLFIFRLGPFAASLSLPSLALVEVVTALAFFKLRLRGLHALLARAAVCVCLLCRANGGLLKEAILMTFLPAPPPPPPPTSMPLAGRVLTTTKRHKRGRHAATFTCAYGKWRRQAMAQRRPRIETRDAPHRKFGRQNVARGAPGTAVLKAPHGNHDRRPGSGSLWRPEASRCATRAAAH